MPCTNELPESFATEIGNHAPGCTVSHADIARLAYQHWIDRGCPQGAADEDWFEAEKEL